MIIVHGQRHRECSVYIFKRIYLNQQFNDLSINFLFFMYPSSVLRKRCVNYW